MQLFIATISAPSCACRVFCRMNDLDVEEVQLRLGTEMMQQEPYTKLIPLHKVPFLLHDNFGLPESCAILSYLANVFRNTIADHWYPSDMKQQTVVDALMHWHHTTLRTGEQLIEREIFVEMQQKGRIRQDIVEEGGKKMQDAFAVLEEEFLRDTEFCSIPSTHVSIGMLPSVADLLIVCELESLRVLRYFPHVDKELRNVHDFKGFPRIIRYLNAMHRFCAPHLGEVLKIYDKIAKNQQRRSKM